MYGYFSQMTTWKDYSHGGSTLYYIIYVILKSLYVNIHKRDYILNAQEEFSNLKIVNCFTKGKEKKGQRKKEKEKKNFQ